MQLAGSWHAGCTYSCALEVVRDSAPRGSPAAGSSGTSADASSIAAASTSRCVSLTTPSRHSGSSHGVVPSSTKPMSMTSDLVAPRTRPITYDARWCVDRSMSTSMYCR
eukprot:356930-Chlamydomonas_euryale.AAC.1